MAVGQGSERGYKRQETGARQRVRVSCGFVLNILIGRCGVGLGMRTMFDGGAVFSKVRNDKNASDGRCLQKHDCFWKSDVRAGPERQPGERG